MSATCAPWARRVAPAPPIRRHAHLRHSQVLRGPRYVPNARRAPSNMRLANPRARCASQATTARKVPPRKCLAQVEHHRTSPAPRALMYAHPSPSASGRRLAVPFPNLALLLGSTAPAPQTMRSTVARSP